MRPDLPSASLACIRFTPLNPLTSRQLALGLVLFSLTGLAAAVDSPQNTVAKLKRVGEISRQPTLPFFCGNVHVSCAGQTSIETFAFKLRATLTHGAIDAIDANSASMGAANVRKPFENGTVDWDTANAYVILHASLANHGYIKLQADGAYVFRAYPLDEGVMSFGRCH